MGKAPTMGTVGFKGILDYVAMGTVTLDAMGIVAIEGADA